MVVNSWVKGIAYLPIMAGFEGVPPELCGDPEWLELYGDRPFKVELYL